MLRPPPSMTAPTPTPNQALSFYRAALPAARLLGRDNEHYVLDADANLARAVPGPAHTSE